MPVTAPTSLDAARRRARRRTRQRLVLAGGTDLMVEVNDGRRRPGPSPVLAARAASPSCARCSAEGDELVIGAGVTYTELDGRARGVARARAGAGGAHRRLAADPQRRARSAATSAPRRPPATRCPVLVALGAVGRARRPRRPRGSCRSPSSSPGRSAPRSRRASSSSRCTCPCARGPQEYLKVGVRNAMVIAVASLAIVVDLDARTRRRRPRLGRARRRSRAPDACAWLAATARLARRRRRRRAPPTSASSRELVAGRGPPIDDHRGTRRLPAPRRRRAGPARARGGVHAA